MCVHFQDSSSCGLIWKMVKQNTIMGEQAQMWQDNNIDNTDQVN